MKRAKHIQDELQELKADVLAKLPLSTPYSVPEGYFSDLSSEIPYWVSAVEEQEPQISIPQALPFEKPSPTYFEQFSANLIKRIQEESEPEWSKKMPYQVPLGYFEAFPRQMSARLRRVAVSPDTRRVPLFRAVRLAASVALILFTGLGMMHIHKRQALSLQANALSQADIRNYVEANLDEFDTDLILNGLATNTQKEEKVELHVTPEEIKAYLDESGWN